MFLLYRVSSITTDPCDPHMRSCRMIHATRHFDRNENTCFSVTQNGQMKVKIEGANTPLLNSQILSLTPANADADDLEVCFKIICAPSRLGMEQSVICILPSACSYASEQENPLYVVKQERERIARGEVPKKGGAQAKKK